MKTSELIRKLCVEHGISIAELARRIGQSPQNFGKKIKRETVSREEMQQIAEVFGLTYEQAFTKESTDNMLVSIDNPEVETELINQYYSNEIGVSFAPVDEKDKSKEGYMELKDISFTRLNSIFQSIPHFAAELQAKRISADAYKVIYDKGLGHLQQSAKNRDRFRANIVEFGTNNKVTGQAELEKFQLKVTSPTLAIFNLAAVVTNQYYLARIDNKLASLDNKLEYIQMFLDVSKKSDLWANGQFLKSVSSMISEITQEDQYRLVTLATVQDIRKNALSYVRFYHTKMSGYVEKHFDKNLKDYSKTKEYIEEFFGSFDAYCYAIYVYGFSYVVEIALSQLTNEAYLTGVKKEIEGVINEFSSDHTRELEKFIETAKSLNPGFLTEAFSHYKPTVDPAFHSFHGVYSASASALVHSAFAIGSLIAKADKNKKNARKEEAEKQFKEFRDRTETAIKELNSPLSAIDRMNELFNKPVELLIDGESIFMKLPKPEQEEET